VAPETGVVAFSNLGRDAIMVVPRVMNDDYSSRPH
jgi:hypothetical protein